MEKTPSNARERNNAMLRAGVLLFIAMALSGFGVSLFKTESFFEKVENAKACKLTRDTLNHLNALAALLPGLEKQYDTIIVLDQGWEREQSANAKANHRTAIRQIEEGIREQLPQLKKEESGLMGKSVFNAYNNLLTARTQLWELRDKRIGPPVDPCAETIRGFDQQLNKIGTKARDIANRLEREKTEVGKVKVGLVNFRKKDVEDYLDGVSGRLDNMIRELRSFE